MPTLEAYLLSEHRFHGDIIVGLYLAVFALNDVRIQQRIAPSKNSFFYKYINTCEGLPSEVLEAAKCGLDRLQEDRIIDYRG